MKQVWIMVSMAMVLIATGCSSTKTTATPTLNDLEGPWELTYITGPRISFEGLYPHQKPTIRFAVAENRISGNTSCNNFMGKLQAEGNRISFKEPMAMTKMACAEGNGESVFLATLEKVDSWKMGDDKTLQLSQGNLLLMQFVKK